MYVLYRFFVFFSFSGSDTNIGKYSTAAAEAAAVEQASFQKKNKKHNDIPSHFFSRLPTCVHLEEGQGKCIIKIAVTSLLEPSKITRRTIGHQRHAAKRDQKLFLRQKVKVRSTCRRAPSMENCLRPCWKNLLSHEQYAASRVISLGSWRRHCQVRLLSFLTSVSVVVARDIVVRELSVFSTLSGCCFFGVGAQGFFFQTLQLSRLLDLNVHTARSPCTAHNLITSLSIPVMLL